ncbi:MAG: S8 family serine peptidase [Solirubrobacteraceae bacterium]
MTDTVERSVLSSIPSNLTHRPRIWPLLWLLPTLAILFGPALAFTATASAAGDYVPGEVVVASRPPVASAAAVIRSEAGAAVSPSAASPPAPSVEVLSLPRGASVTAAAARFSHLPGIVYAVPNYIAHLDGHPMPSTSTARAAAATTTTTSSGAATGSTPPAGTPAWFPNDTGNTRSAGGWERLQWNFLAGGGVNAPEAWANLIADHRPGARGVVVAILDTGVAFRDWETFKESPDFVGTRFIDPCDLVAGKIVHGVCTNPYPLDREGHGTFVAGEIAEATNNHYGLTGLAYGASIMPVRVLDANGDGDASTIALGIRYAVQHGAKVINLSLEFSIGVTAGEIPDIISAIAYAHREGAVVVAAAGNDSSNQIAYPAEAPHVVSVGATTLDRCLADYSNIGSGLDLVSPGGGDDSGTLNDPDCRPDRNLPNVYQMTFNNPAAPDQFSMPSGWYGTSMAAPAVAAAAAMVIASGVLGSHPTPDQILARLEQTAQPLGGAAPNADYGYGLLDIGAATARATGAATPHPTAAATVK